VVAISPLTVQESGGVNDSTDTEGGEEEWREKETEEKDKNTRKNVSE